MDRLNLGEAIAELDLAAELLPLALGLAILAIVVALTIL
jgi:hypothetical protein